MHDEPRVGTMLPMERSSLRPPVPRFEQDHDHVIVLRGISWTHYESLLDARGERAQPRFAYLEGVLEIMTTSRRHEVDKKLIARLLEAYAVEAQVELTGVGNATFRKELEKAGLEPDECYYLDRFEESPPDIAIEIVFTSGGVNKLEIYRRLGVREVWFWIDGRFWLYALVDNKYRESRASNLVPGFEFDEVARIVTTSDEAKQTSVVRTYQDAVRARLSGGTRPSS
jgi:Uma2 family endonuclease